MKPLRIAAVALLLTALTAGAAHAEREPMWKGPSRHAALLTATPSACVAEISKKMRDLERFLPAADIPADLFTKTPYETVRSDTPGYNGKPGVYSFHLAYDEFDQQCKLVDRDDGMLRPLPGCECKYIDPAAAAEPSGEDLTQRHVAGRLKALEESCASSARPLDGQAAEYRKALAMYFDFKVRIPALLESVKRKPSYGDRRSAWEFAKAKGGLERREFSQKVYAATQAELTDGKVGGRDAVCQGAADLLADKIAGIVLEMKTFESTHKVKVSETP